jgi:hypothetical protein
MGEAPHELHLHATRNAPTHRHQPPPALPPHLRVWTGMGTHRAAVGVRVCSTHGDCVLDEHDGAVAATAPAQHCRAPPGFRWQPLPPHWPQPLGQHTTPRGPARRNPPYAAHVARPASSAAVAHCSATRRGSSRQMRTGRRIARRRVDRLPRAPSGCHPCACGGHGGGLRGALLLRASNPDRGVRSLCTGE